MARRQQHERNNLQIVPDGERYSLIAEQPHADALRDLLRSAKVPIYEDVLNISGDEQISFCIEEEHLAVAREVLNQYQKAE